MSDYFSKYQGRGGPAIAPGIVQMMGSIGDEYAKGIAGLAEGIEKYRKNKKELGLAQATFEDLTARTDPEVVMYSVDSKRMQKIQDGKGTVEDFLSATNSINARIEDIEKFKEQDVKDRERKATQEYREATLKQGDEKLDVQRRLANASISKSAAELAEKDEKKMQDTAYLETEARLAEISPVRFEEYAEPNVPQSAFGPPMMSSRKINRTPEEMRAEALEIFASRVPEMGVSNAGALMERINEAYPTPLTSNLKVTTLPDGEKFVENVKSGWAQQVKDDKGESPTVTAAKIRSKDLEIDRRLDAVEAVDAKIESRKKDIVEIKKAAGGAMTLTDQELIDTLESEIEKLEEQKRTSQNRFKFTIEGGVEPK